MNVKDYLRTVETAANWEEATDMPPSRIRAILKTAFSDYFAKKIEEKILIEVAIILDTAQIGTWDYDPELNSITCRLSDQGFEKYKLPKEKRVKLYKELYKSVIENETKCVSVPKSH